MEIENGILVSIEASDIKEGVLTLPKKVKVIADEVITACEGLVKVIGLGVAQLGNYNFLYCNALTSVEFPQLAQLGNDNFLYCNALTSVKFPQLAQLGNYNFLYCNALTSVEFPQLAQLGNDNFFYCNALTSVKFPQLAQLGSDNFYECNALTSVEFPQLAQLGSDNFRVCNALTSVEFPQLAQLGSGNFYKCNALTSVESPQLTQLGSDNFYECNALTALKFKNNDLKIKCADSYPFVIESDKITKGITIYSGFNFDGTDANGHLNIDLAYVAEKGGFTAHGKTVKQAIADVEFKIIAEKLQNDPITPDTELTVLYYRTVTGACDFGCREFMTKNGISYDIIDGRTVEKAPIKAKDLLPILEKSNAYGLERFKQLITF